MYIVKKWLQYLIVKKLTICIRHLEDSGSFFSASICVWLCKLFLMWGKIIFSSVLAIRDKRAMCRYDVPFCKFFLDLRMAVILPSFQIWGILFWLRLMLYMCVRYVTAFWPKCFKRLMLMSSGPVELLFSTCCIVFWSEIKTCLFCCFLSFCLLTLLLCIVEYFVVSVNCWAFSAFVVAWAWLSLCLWWRGTCWT